MTLRKQRGEFPIRGQEAFLRTASDKKIRRSRYIGRRGKNKRIDVLSRLAAPWSEDGVMTLPLLGPLGGERAAGNIHCRAERAGECKQIRMFERQVDRAKTSHRATDDCAAGPSCCDWKSAFDIGDQIAHDVILVPVLRLRGGVGVVGGVALRHDENQSGIGKARYIGIVRPSAKTATTSVEQVNRWILFAGANVFGKHHAVRHIPVERRAVKRDILHDHICGETRLVVRDFVLILVAANYQEQKYTEQCRKTQIGSSSHSERDDSPSSLTLCGLASPTPTRLRPR